jgi:hypothetical protein
MTQDIAGYLAKKFKGLVKGNSSKADTLQARRREYFLTELEKGKRRREQLLVKQDDLVSQHQEAIAKDEDTTKLEQELGKLANEIREIDAHENEMNRLLHEANPDKYPLVQRTVGEQVFFIEKTGRTVVVERKGTEYAKVGGGLTELGEVFEVVHGLALVGTREVIEGFLSAHRTARFVNPNLTAERGGAENMLMDSADSGNDVKIGVAASAFHHLPEKDRYNVIDPFVATVKLLTPRAAGVLAAGIQAAAPAHEAGNAIAEELRAGLKKVGDIGDIVEGAKGVLRPDGGGSKDSHEYILTFSQTGEPPVPSKAKVAKASLTCKPFADGRYGIFVDDAMDTLLGLIDKLG